MNLLDYIFDVGKVEELKKYLIRKVRFNIVVNKYKIKQSNGEYVVSFLGAGINTQLVRFALKYKNDRNALKREILKFDKIHPKAKEKIINMIENGADLLYIAKKFNIRLRYYPYVRVKTKKEALKAINLICEIKNNLPNIDLKILKTIMESDEIMEKERGIF